MLPDVVTISEFFLFDAILMALYGAETRGGQFALGVVLIATAVFAFTVH